jgi:hypothetical protein
MNNIGGRKNMKNRFISAGSISVCIVLVSSMLSTVVSAQVIESNEIQAKIPHCLNDKMKNNDRSLSNDINIKLLKGFMKDTNWFPGQYILYVLVLFLILINILLNIP